MSSTSVARLPYVLQSVSSSDPSHSSLSSPHGWQSVRLCSYPQSLLLWLGCVCDVRKVQLLSHQSKIARTVELYAGTRSEQSAAGRDSRAEAVDWARLGFFSLDANEKSAYKARELKVTAATSTPHIATAAPTTPTSRITSHSHPHCVWLDCPLHCAAQSVPLSCQCEWLRVLLKGCHVNPLNVDKQVGIVALHIMGQQLTPPAPSFSVTGHLSPTPSSLSALSPLPRPSVSSELDVSTSQYLSHLHQLKAAAIDAEDFDAAKQMKARIDRLLRVIPDIVDCERRKRDAIAREEYDEAKECKKEADRLREAALRDRGAVDERKEERTEPASQRGKRRESRHVVDLPELEVAPLQQQKHSAHTTAQLLLDDDRPIRPAKQPNDGVNKTATTAADERPLDGPTARAKDNKQMASSDEDNSFPVNHAVVDERPLRPAEALKASTDERQPPLPVSSAVEAVSPRTLLADPNDDRALPVSSGGSSGYAFESSDDMLPQSSSSSLPSAEPLSSVAKGEAEPLIALLGLDLTQSLYSRHWQLRADAVQVITQLVADEASPVRAAGSVSMSVLVRDMSRVLQRTLTDKAAPVFVHACRLLEIVLREAVKANSNSSESASGTALREEVKGLVDSVSRVMADRLSSSNAREREQASQILTYLALHKASPAAAVPNVLLAPLKKKNEHYTPLRARCLILQTLVQRIGLHDAGGLSLTPLMRFALICVAHRDAGVRDAAFNLIALVCQRVDKRKVDAQLKDVPVSTLASLDQRVADVRDGRYTVATAEVTDRPLDDRSTPKEHAQPPAPAKANPVNTRLDTETDSSKQQQKQSGQRGAAAREQSEAELSGGGNTAATLNSALREAHEVESPPSKPRKQPKHIDKEQQQQPLPREERKAGQASIMEASSAQPQRQQGQHANKLPQAAIPAHNKPRGVVSERDDTYSDDEYDDEQQSEPHHAPSRHPAAAGRDEDRSSAVVPNAGSPSHFRLNHAHNVERSSGADDSTATTTAAMLDSASSEAEHTEGGDAYPAMLHKCQFCGLEDPSFDEDALDLHYWQACPMLLSCPHCEQVVEIPTFAEHLTGECEGEGQWMACSHCGWVVLEGQLAEHEAECGGVRSGWAVCQLCCKDVEGSEDGWRQHLLVDQCSASVRTNGTAVAPLDE